MEPSAPGTVHARIGIIGGSGTYRIPGAAAAASRPVRTPYGPTSAPVTVAEIAGRSVAFLPRHGTGHSVPPQKINYRANLWALKSLGVEAVLSSSAVGGLRAGLRAGDLRGDGPADRPDVGTHRHVLRRHHRPASSTCRRRNPSARSCAPCWPRRSPTGTWPTSPQGTVVVVNGPRFSTKAESAWYVSGGADIISMTQYPEPVLAAELNMGFANLAFVTDSDTGHDGSEPVTAEAVFARIKHAQPNILAVLEATVAAIGESYCAAPADGPGRRGRHHGAAGHRRRGAAPDEAPRHRRCRLHRLPHRRRRPGPGLVRAGPGLPGPAPAPGPPGP